MNSVGSGDVLLHSYVCTHYCIISVFKVMHFILSQARFHIRTQSRLRLYFLFVAA